MQRVTIVGVGGVGSNLADWVARYLESRGEGDVLTLVDGDIFEDKNRSRQAFDRLGKKAEVVAAMLAARYPSLEIQVVADYLSPENADFVIFDGDIVLAAVDNHKSRKLLADIAASRSDLSLISGGNELTDGDVFIHLRRNGADLTPPLTQNHPELIRPADRAPFEMSCEELAAAGAPQIFFANLGVALIMAWALWRLLERPETVAALETVTESYFDIVLGCIVSRRISARPMNGQSENPAEPKKEESDGRGTEEVSQV
ncbi:ThiF family adenylyltransferase [Candidatus Uhrbacteria bacterium]|nr:ThiF family adenylyltransferase [Candidatus Uhrbacteria bacterium]